MKFKLIIAVFFLTITLCAQENILKGRVTDSGNGNAVQGAVIMISNSITASTNYNGTYQIRKIPEGKYVVKISRIGYKTLSDTILINSFLVVKDFVLESSPIELDEVIVSTDIMDRYLRESTYSEAIIDAAELSAKPLQSISDILQDEPGISLLRDGIWGTEVSIRGLNRENIVTLINGSRIATSTDVAARLSMVNSDDIERIEVIKGGSSTIYGSGATGGIINIITKKPMAYESLSLNGSISSGYNTVNNMSATSGAIFGGSSSWSAKISGAFRKASNATTPSGELKNSQFQDYSLSGSLNIIPFTDHVVNLEYQLFKAKDVGIPGAAVFPTNAVVRYPDEKREMISAGYEVKNISKFLYSVSGKYSYQFIERNVENLPFTTQVTPQRRVSVLKITPNADHKNNNLQVQGNFIISDFNSLAIGLDYWDRSYRGSRERFQLIEALNTEGNVVSSTNRIIGEKPLPDSKYRSLGLFAQDDILFNEKIAFSLSARYDNIKVEGDRTLNPLYEITNGNYNGSPAGQKVIWDDINITDASYSGNLGIKYTPLSNLYFTLGIGLSFRSPSLEERFQFIDQGSFIRVGNPGLESEEGKTLDFGIRYYSADFKFISSVFYSHFNNLVSEMPGTFDGRNAFIKTNIGKARLYGFDFKADNSLTDYLVTFATVSYVKGDDITANGNLPEIPPLNGNFGIRLSIPVNIQWELSAAVFANQNKTAAGELRTPGYAYFNFSFITTSFNYGRMNLKLAGGIENVFNREYRNHLSTNRGLIITEPGRNFFIKFLIDF